MLPVEGLSQLQQLVRNTVSAPAPVQALQAAQMETRFVTGQRIDVAVVAALANGRYQVLANGEKLDVNLPMPAKPGDRLEMRVVSNVPKLVLALGRDAPMPHDSPRGPPLSALTAGRVSLSDTGTRLSSLLQQIAGQPKLASPAMQQAAPLIAGAPTAPAELAGALRTSLLRSGLFYESHQADWVVGKLAVTELLAEPQGRLAQLPFPRRPAASSADNATQAAEAPALRRAADLAGEATGSLPVHKDAVAMVQQQLQTLESGRLMWQGEVWPGQQLAWRVEEQSPRAESPAAPAGARHWSTSLRLQLPGLGEIEAVLNFEASGLSVAFRAGDAGTVDTLAGARPDLREAIEAGGLHVLSLTVKQDEKNR